MSMEYERRRIRIEEGRERGRGYPRGQHVEAQWYRTPAIAHCRCHRCSDTIPKGEPMAFRSAKYERDRRIYCEDCAAELGIKAVDSKRMLKARQLEMSL